ncbi:glutaredoxin [Vibrio phage 1.081.O._10N.286.52.C2]|nr:glutaredoxin [Vibrio phage 1.081.O._10N.286.52.C2]
MITIYTIPNCDGCRHAIAFCKFKKIPYDVVELTTQDAVDKLHVKLGQNMNVRVPLIMHEDTLIGHLPELKKWVNDNLYK